MDVILYGYAMGGNATLQASLVAETFGRLHYGAIYGRLTPFVMLAQALGIPFTGYLRDRTGSWEPAMAAIVAASVIAVGLVLRVRLPDSDEDLALRLLDREGVLVHPGYFFDFATDDFLVLSLLPAPDDFAAGVRKLAGQLC